MGPSKEPCRNFQRGHCQYGDRCRFLHANQQQPKPNPNPFGFGTQNTTHVPRADSQPQKPNPFGFGVQNNAHKANQFKPGENKWSRFSPAGGNASSAPQKQNNQSSSAPNHVCTDSESCKRQIMEDFEHEKPLWKLTCYGHSKYGPCDINGDLSYEEVRASAYDDAKRGTNIQTIVEKERTLLSSKLIEFENLLRNPYTPPQNKTFTTPNVLPGTTTNVFPQPIQNNAPPSFSSFSQLGTNTGFQMRPAAQNNAFAQANQFQAPTTQIPNAFQSNTFAFGKPAQLGGQPSTQPFASSFLAPTSTFNNAFPAAATSNINSTSQQPFTSFSGNNSSANVVPAPLPSFQMPQNIPNSNSNGDNSIWYKDEWTPGEIPEEAPPKEVIC